MNLKCDWRFSDFNIPYSRKAWCGEYLANLLFLSIWQKYFGQKVINCKYKFSLGITDDFPSFPAIRYVKL